MAQRGRKVNRRKASSGGKKTLLFMVILAVVVAAAIVIFGERRKGQAPPATPATTGVTSTPHLPIPQRPASEMDNYTSEPATPVKPAETKAKGPGKVAIIIDDMGSSMQELQGLLAIRLPITFSVIPSLAHAKGVAETAHGAGADVMVHMPMEPEGYPKQPMEKIGLLLSMPDNEIVDRVNGYFRSVPFAVGANNHMGSRFTQNADKMEAALSVLKEKDVFFVDSRTSPASVGYEKAKMMGIKCAARQVFLDNVQDETAIRKQLEQAVMIARKKGAAIAIGHPHAATIRALQSAMPQLATSGITFVKVSTLVR